MMKSETATVGAVNISQSPEGLQDHGTDCTDFIICVQDTHAQDCACLFISVCV